MKTNKKGFTLVELVIVIAVIAILAAVLLPTFAGIIKRAKYNSALQTATSTRDEYFSTHLNTIEEMKGATIYVLEKEGSETIYVFTVGANGTLTNAAAEEGPKADAELPESAVKVSATGYVVMPVVEEGEGE